MGPKPQDTTQRFLSKITSRDGCWIWGGTMHKNGYGLFHLKEDGRWQTKWAHRVSFAIHRRPLQSGETIDHLCRNTRCVNPDHLEAVSQQENSLRSPFTLPGKNARKTHCPHGHSYLEHGFLDSGKRKCRICVRARNREAHRRRAALQ